MGEVGDLYETLRNLGLAHRVGDEAGHDVGVHVGVGATIFDIALLVLRDLPRDADRRATVGHAVFELGPVRRLVLAGEAVFGPDAVARDVLHRFTRRAQRFARIDDRIPTRAHGLGREVRVRAGAVPVAAHGLGDDRRIDPEV